MVYIALCLAILLAGFIIGYKVGCDICYNRFKEHIKKLNNKLYDKNKSQNTA